MADERQWARDKANFIARAHEVEHSIDGSDQSPLMTELTTLTRELLDASSVADVLEQVVWAARQVVPGADLVSVTLRSADGVFHTPVETDPVATELDQLQYKTGEGPCVDAARKSGPAYVRSDDLAGEPAWPRFGPTAAQHGYTAVLSTALVPDARPPELSGALNIYTRGPGPLGDRAQDIALLLATHASLALSATKVVALAELRETQLRQAIESRDVIGQAKGILMHRRGIDAEEAFDLLRRASQDLNVKLAELAEALTTRHTDLDHIEI